MTLPDRLQHLWILLATLRVEIHHHATSVPLSHTGERLIADLDKVAGPSFLLERAAGDRLDIHIRAKLTAVDRTAGFGRQRAYARQAADRNVLAIENPLPLLSRKTECPMALVSSSHSSGWPTSRTAPSGVRTSTAGSA